MQTLQAIPARMALLLLWDPFHHVQPEASLFEFKLIRQDPVSENASRGHFGNKPFLHSSALFSNDILW